jgi:hypothetical protein
MAGDIISKKTRLEFRERFVGWTLHTISMEFDAADIARDTQDQPPESGARRCLVEQYYRTLNFADWNDVARLLVVYEGVLDALEQQVAREPGDNFAKEALATLIKLLGRDGFNHVNGRILHKGRVANLTTVRAAAAAFDVPELHRQLTRLQAAVDDDPGLAIGTAKELVETTCKTILHARGIEFGEHSDVTELVGIARKTLALLPEDVPNSAKGAKTMRALLGNLGTIAQGLAELRNLYGTGHGKTGSSRGLSPRHGRLAVGSAATLATFLLETHEARMAGAKVDVVEKEAAGRSEMDRT